MSSSPTKATSLTDEELEFLRQCAKLTIQTWPDGFTPRRVVATIDARDERIQRLLWLVGEKDKKLRCEGPTDKPAEYVSREMAIDAGEPTMEGTLLTGAVWEPCGSCGPCRALALTEADAPKGKP